MSFSIDLDKDPEESIKTLMQERLDTCREALQDQSHPHTAIHKAKKEFKKLRAICRMVRDEIGKDPYRVANYFFRDTARKLSDARDASAMLETLYDLEQKLTDKAHKALLKKIKSHLGSKKAALTRIQINQQQLLQEVLEDLKEAEQYFSVWSFQNQDFSIFHSSIERVYQRCRKGLRNAYKEGTPEAFHEWRKRVKYLRYQMDVLTPVWPKPMAVLDEELHTLTDYLGDDHDLTVLQEYIEQMQTISSHDQENLFEPIATMKKGLQKLAEPLGHKLFYLKPSHFTGLIGSWWTHHTTPYLTQKEKLVLA